MVSMPLWEIGHCDTSDLGGSMSVQSVARGARWALARSVVQRVDGGGGGHGCRALLRCLATSMYCYTRDRSTDARLWTGKITQFPTYSIATCLQGKSYLLTISPTLFVREKCEQEEEEVSEPAV